MLNRNNFNQLYKSNEIVIPEFKARKSSKIFATYLDKIKSLDVEQVKIYLGMAYFVILSLVTLSLLA